MILDSIFGIIVVIVRTLYNTILLTTSKEGYIDLEYIDLEYIYRISVGRKFKNVDLEYNLQKGGGGRNSYRLTEKRIRSILR